MTAPTMTQPIDARPEGDGDAMAESEPPRTCADIVAGDERWSSVEGFEDLIPRLVSAALAEAGMKPEKRAVSVALLSDAEVRALNKAFRGKDAATNVLSFPSAPAPGSNWESTGPLFLGDVALSYETVIEEAAAQNKPVLNHAAHLVVHGVLHLAGLDHGSDADAEHMEAAERLILGRFGIPDPYAEDGLLSSTTGN